MSAARKKEVRHAVMRSGSKCVWVFAKDGRHETAIEPGACPFCGQEVVTALPAPLLAVQPDGTTHVCHPAFGGCNHGFAKAGGQ